MAERSEGISSVLSVYESEKSHTIVCPGVFYHYHKPCKLVLSSPVVLYHVLGDPRKTYIRRARCTCTARLQYTYCYIRERRALQART